MKAAQYNSLGPAKEVLELVELDAPTPAHGEVLVRLSCSAVHPSDVKKRAGAFPDLLNDGFIIPHSDGAGTIEAVGRGVPHSRIGERVWVYQAQYGRRFGTAAEYVAVDSSRAVLLPDNTGFDVGACMGIPAMTAHRCVFADGSVEGQTILVIGGAGRVGHYVIQWAKYAGAQVIATASNPEAEAHCYAAGADVVCPHQGDELINIVTELTEAKGVDRIVDSEFGANLPVLLDVAGTGATIATYGSMQVPEPSIPFRRMMFLDLTIRMLLVYAMPEAAKLDAIYDITDFLERDLLQHRIAHQVSLEKIVDAHELIERGGFYGAVIVGLE
ncbi:MAG: NADPH:quinone reductase [Gammaproteobacteria bacterium]|nr:MAG: NADPH:quinone reductase [Gammaproteobacteria bacterium]RKZ72100.1 MAG: NADPH:quinone reductase [Gammaproteobacteria bacterium]